MKNDTSHWLESLDDTLTLKDICLPGIDHSGVPQLILGSDDEQGIEEKGVNYFQELSAGIRFFDFSVFVREVARNTTEKAISTSHFFIDHRKGIEVLLGDVLDQFDHFFTCEAPAKPSKETVVICFSAFKKFRNSDKKYFLDLLEAKIGHWLLEKEVVGRQSLSAIPLSALRGKIIVLLKEKLGQSVYYPYGITKNIYKWGEELVVYHRVMDGNSPSERINKQILDFISFVKSDFLYQFTPKDWGEIVDLKTASFQKNPLFTFNAHGEKVNIISVKWGNSIKELVTICSHVSGLREKKGTLGQVPHTNKRYLIRSAAKMDFCLSLFLKDTTEGDEFPVDLQQKNFYDAPLPGQSVRLIKHTIAQHRFTFEVDVSNRGTYQLSQKGNEVIASAPVSDRFIQWLLEPYYQPIMEKDGTVDRYQRQEGFYLIINDEQKTCLCLEKPTQPAPSKLSLRPYHPCQEVKEMVWCFEEVPND